MYSNNIFTKEDYSILELLKNKNYESLYLNKDKITKYIRNKPSKKVLEKLKDFLVRSKGYIYSKNKNENNYKSNIIIKIYEKMILDIDNSSELSKKMIISKCFFQTWKTRNLEGNYKLASNSWQTLNKTYKYELSDDFDCRDFIKNNFTSDILNAYDKLIPGALKADLWRYCKLYIEGGIYCDMDLVCLVNLEDYFFSDYDMVTVLDLKMSGGGIFQGFLAVTKKNIIIKNLIEGCIESINNDKYYEDSLVMDGDGNLKCKGALSITGPLLFKKVLKKINRRLVLKEGHNIVGDTKIRLFRYNKNDTITFNNEILFKHRYVNYAGNNDASYYAELWENKKVFRTTIVNKFTKNKKIDLHYYSEIKDLHYNNISPKEIFTIFTFNEQLFLIVKNKNDVKLYFFMENELYFKKNIKMPFNSDKLDFLLYSQKKYIFLNQYKGGYELIYMNNDLDYEDKWELNFLSGNIVTEKSFNQNIVNIISGNKIYYVNVNNKKYTQNDIKFNNNFNQNIIDKILDIHGNKIALIAKENKSYMFVKLNNKHEIIQNSCDFALNNKKIYKIECFNNIFYLYSVKNNTKKIHYMKVDYLGDFLIKNITDDIRINNKIYMNTQNFINYNDPYFTYEYCNIDKLRELIKEKLNNYLNTFDSLPTQLSKIIFGNYCLLYLNGGIIINNYFTIDCSFYKVISEADLILVKDKYNLHIAFIASKKNNLFIKHIIDTIDKEVGKQLYYNFDNVNSSDLFSLFLTKQFKLFFNVSNLLNLNDTKLKEIDIKFINLYNDGSYNKVATKDYNFYIKSPIFTSDIFEINLWKNKKYYLDIFQFNEKILLCSASSIYKSKKFILLSEYKIKIIGEKYIYDEFIFDIKNIKNNFYTLNITSKFKAHWNIKFCIVRNETLKISDTELNSTN